MCNRSLLTVLALAMGVFAGTGAQAAEVYRYAGEEIKQVVHVDEGNLIGEGESVETLLPPGPDDYEFYLYANETGRVRSGVSVRAAREPTENVARLTWRHHFAKVPGSQSRGFTVNPIKMEAALGMPFQGPEDHPADEPFPIARVDIRIIAGGFAPPYMPNAPSDDFIIFQTRLPFRHVAHLCAWRGSDRLELCLEHTEVNGAHFTVVDEMKIFEYPRPGTLEKGIIKSSVIEEFRYATYETEAYHGEIVLPPAHPDGTEYDRYWIAYELEVHAYAETLEGFAFAFLGDPLDPESGMVLDEGDAIEFQPARTCATTFDDERYVFSTDRRLVVDRYTGLQWQRCPVGTTLVVDGGEDPALDRCDGGAPLSWQEALQRSAEDLSGGYDDWRVPNVKELGSLIEDTCVGIAMDSAAFLPGGKSLFYTSTTDPLAADRALAVYFGTGDLMPLPKDFGAAARLVRDAAMPARPPAAVSLARARVVEDDGAQQVLVPVLLSRVVHTDVILSYTTQDGSAAAGSDYAAASGSITIPARSRRAEIPIAILDDDLAEGPETFDVFITGVSENAAVGLAHNTVEIVDDEPVVRIWDADVYESGGTRTLEFLVTVNREVDTPVSIDFTTADESAVAGSDYTAVSGVVTFPAGQSTAQIISVPVLDDTLVEGDERLTVTLSNPSSNARLAVDTAYGHVIDDDLAGMAQLNDTGNTQCANELGSRLDCPQNDYPGQDAEFGRDVSDYNESDGIAGFVFTKLDHEGVALADQNVDYDTTPWDCVHDEVTGLMWEVKTRDGGLRDRNSLFTWYNSTGINDGGAAGTPNGGQCSSAGNCDIERYIAAVNAAGLCGYSDWRAPSLQELVSIGTFYPSSIGLDSAYFPDSPTTLGASHSWWSATPAVQVSDGTLDTGSAWSVSFVSGFITRVSDKSSQRYLRLVRGETN